MRPLVAFALVAGACISDPHGQCATDAQCASGPAGSFCADGVCQGPPRGSVQVPSRAFSRSETLSVTARVERCHGTPSAQVLLGGATIAAQPAGNILAADVPLSLAPAGVEGAVPFSVELRDDLGHVTSLQSSVLVDDRAPRIAIDPASVPAAAVLRGTVVSLRVTIQDMSAVTVAGATQNTDGSYTVPFDTRMAPSNSATLDAVVTATDAVGNVGTAHAAIPLTRLKFAAHHPTNLSIQSIVLSDTLIWGSTNTSELWFLRRTDGATLLRPAIGTALPEIATDGSRLFFARSDGNVCTIDATGAAPVCCPLNTSLTSGPILQNATAIVAFGSGSSTYSSRLVAVAADSGCTNKVPSGTLGDFYSTTAALGPDGIVYAGAVRAIAAEQFNVSWSNSPATTESSHYLGQPAFRGNGVVLLATTVGSVETFTFTNPLGAAAPTPVSTQVATYGAVITSPTIAADGTAVIASDDLHLTALRPDNSVRWSIALPSRATAPPSNGAGDLVYVGTFGGDILAIHLADGSTAWSYSAGAPIRGPLAPGCDGILYASTDGSVLAFVTDASGLADSPWPRAAHDVRGTGDARRPLRTSTGGCLE